MAVTSATSGASIHVDSIVSGLMSLERIPLDKLNSKETSYQAKLTALGSKARLQLYKPPPRR